ncbi:hypothetical protein, partial [Thioclava sp. DLFJ5-1]|uniref:hypothetical protein n=1 Tax=Thioclava sp. DLFJ5-1 TaxID=1915314 RepID=UPI001AEFF508
AAGWVGSSHPEITPPNNFHHPRDTTVPEFYDLVGVNLKAWQAPPPKPVKSRTAPDPGELEPNDLGDAGSLP